MLGIASHHEPVSYWDITETPILERAKRPLGERRATEKRRRECNRPLSQLAKSAGRDGETTRHQRAWDNGISYQMIAYEERYFL